MRRTLTRGLGLLAAAVALYSTASTAGATQDTAVPVPSCSLHPTVNTDGTYTFTKDTAKDQGNSRWLTVLDDDGNVVFNADLAPGDTTGPLPVTLTAQIIWGGYPYPVYAYIQVDWCANGDVEADTVIAEPATPPTTAAPTTTEAPATLATEAAVVTAPALVALDATTTTTEPEPEPLVVADEPRAEVGVGGVVVTRAVTEPLPVTGVSTWALVALAVLIVAAGWVVSLAAPAIAALRNDMHRTDR